ncbi:hypothetical protein RvY_08736-2 [Ramazzottius varieornatus]|uniref:Ion transport domain-containing protein n=1 Tax=Ramazzottius varieornatus TaxID=947166 RepID=A0A1D1VCH5_RAMVA|nr:hypothetical protein RvY_08736-2 [Ramazzottius varieornatus]
MAGQPSKVLLRRHLMNGDMEEHRLPTRIMAEKSSMGRPGSAVPNGQASTKPAEPALDLRNPMRLGCIKFKASWVVDPESIGYYRWLFIIFWAILYNVLMIPARTVFRELSEPDYMTAFIVCDYVADFIYFLDIFVEMYCGYLGEERVLVREPRKLMKHWWHTKKGKLDVFALIPTDFAFLATGFAVPYPFIRINRILKYGRITQFARRTEGKVRAADIFRLCVLLLQWIILMHFFACLYYFISEEVGLNSDGWVYPGEASWRKANPGETNDDDSLFRKYTWSFFFSMHTLTMIGITKQPENEWQFLFMTANLVASVMLFSQILGNVSRTIINLNIHENEFRAKMDGVKRYMAMRNIGAELQQRIINYYEYQWTNGQTIDEREAVACLPDKLQAEIAMKVHLETLKHVRIFQGVEAGLLADLVLKLKLQVRIRKDFFPT